MIISVLKHTFHIFPPKELVYRDYKNFDRVIFKRELEDGLNQQIDESKHFEQIFLEILHIHAPIKNKLLRANHVSYMTKALRKVIMKRSELKSKYVKNKTSENLKSYKKQRNFCSKLYKKERKKYYERPYLNNVTDSKKFWKTVKPLSDKNTTLPKISLVQNDEIISDESKVANSFSNFFENAIHSLGIKTNEYSNENYGLKKTVKIAIRKYEQHSSTNLIKENIKNNESFHVLRTKKESNLKEIINLVNKKNGTFLLVVSRMYQVSVAPFQQISGMRKFCLTKIFPKS